MKKSRWSWIIISILTLMGMSGCMRGNRANLNEQAKAYLEEKYNESFTIKASIDKSIDVQYEELFFISETHPDDIVTVYHEKDDSGYYFQDNYYGILVRNEYEQKLKNIIGKHLENYKVYFNFTASYFPDDLNASSSLSDAMQNYENSFYANVYLFISDKSIDGQSADYSEIPNELEAQKMYCYFAVYEVTEEKYSSFTEDNYGEYLSSSYKLNPTYKMIVR